MHILKINHLLLFVFTFILSLNLDSQKLLQLEIYRQVEAVKFGEGSTIVFKTKDRPGEWQTKKIETVITGEDILIFEDGMVNVSDITHFRLQNQTAAAVGKLFTGFGTGWLVFGGIAQLAGRYKFTWSTFAIGVVAVGIGWLFNKIVSKRTFRIGKNANLRIIDISFPNVAPLKKGSMNYP